MQKALDILKYALWVPAGIACLFILAAVTEKTPWWVRLILIAGAIPFGIAGFPGLIIHVVTER